MEREKILSEIRRIAVADGGKSPGKERFHRETGIREADWTKHWIRWSDAVKEAGLLPNKMRGSIEDEYVIGRYVELVRELGHIPVTNELRMKARATAGFPNEKTLKRFGDKKDLIKEVQEYCQARPEYSDVLLVLPKLETEEPEAAQGPAKNDSFVYLLKFGQHYKIGSTKNLVRRFREIKTQMPDDGEIIHQIQTGDPDGIESYWHNYFREKRLKGEWFALSKEDISYFRKRKLM